MQGTSGFKLESYNIWEDIARDFYFNAPLYPKRIREYFGRPSHPWRTAPSKKTKA